MGKDTFLAAVDGLETLLRESAQMRDAEFQDRRKEVLQIRRTIADQNAKIAALGETAFNDPEQRQAFQSAFSKLRSAISLHMASWPVVSIEVADPGYQASLIKQRDAYRHFIAWARSV